MYDQSLILKNLKKISSPVFEKERAKNPKIKKENIHARAVQLAEDGLKLIKYKDSIKKNKTIFQITDPPADIVYRKVGKNIIQQYPTRQKKREYIIGNCLTYLSEATAFNIYRRDIKDFYGTVSTDWIISKLENNSFISNKTIQIIKNFFKKFAPLTNGVPRGTYLSAILSEVSMADFDTYIRTHPQVFFYERYVDDILIITDPTLNEKNFWRNAECLLPSGVEFHTNSEKCSSITIKETGSVTGKAIGDVENSFNFLGYEISCLVSVARQKRELKIEMTSKKVSRYKTKISMALNDYIKSKDFDTLRERIKLLTSNYYVYNPYKKNHMEHGIYCSSKYMNNLEDPDNSLNALDNYLKNLLLSRKGKISVTLRKALSNKQKKQLLRYSFKRGFENRVFYNFSPEEYKILSGCWENA